MNNETLPNREAWPFLRQQSQRPVDQTARQVFADWLEEHDDPERAHIFRHGVPEHRITRHGEGPDGRGVFFADEGRHLRELFGSGTGSAFAHGLERFESVDAPSVVHGHNDSRPAVRYSLHLPGDRYLHLVVPATEGLLRGISDAWEEEHAAEPGGQIPWNPWAAELGMHLHPTSPGVERQPVPLARMVHGQRAPANGEIAGMMKYRGGQFIPKARARIRDIASRLVKLARGDANTTAKGLFGAGATYDQPLTLGELKQIESTYELPESQKLSPYAEQPEGRKGDEHKYSVPLDRAVRFAGHVSRAAIGPGKLKKALLDPSTTDAQKHVHLVTQLLGDYENAPHGSWYGDDISHLDKLLHERFGWGTLDSTGQLVGKGAPHENHPELVLFKTILGMTSPAANPNDNTRSAVSMWAMGKKRADAVNSDDPLQHIPYFQDDYLKLWMQKVAEANGVDSIPNPGTTPAERAKWWAKWIYPVQDKIPGLGYSSQASKIYVHPDPLHPMHGQWFQTEKDGRNPSAPTPSRTNAKLVDAFIPTTDATGALRPKGWSTYGQNTARALKRLKTLVDRFRTPNGGTKQAYRDAAKWLFSFHRPEDFTDDERKRIYSGGFYGRDEAVPGFYIFGPKVGAFITNLHANDPATRDTHGKPFTHDTWMQRALLRHLGRLTTDAKSKSPSASDRRAFRDAATELASRLGITAAELQADLWYYEQGLMRRLGVPGHRIQSFSFRDAANRYLDPTSPHKLGRVTDANIKAFSRGGLAGAEFDPNNHSDMIFADKLEDEDDPRGPIIRQDLSFRGPTKTNGEYASRLHAAKRAAPLDPDYRINGDFTLPDQTKIYMVPLRENAREGDGTESATHYETAWNVLGTIYNSILTHEQVARIVNEFGLNHPHFPRTES